MNTSTSYDQISTTRRVPAGALSLLAAFPLLFAGLESAVAQVAFSRIVDTTMNVPGGDGTFARFTRTGRKMAANYGDRTVFYAEDDNGDEGIYSFTAADGITIVADTSTDVPMVTETKFESFRSFDVGLEGVFFIGAYRNANGFLISGIYHFDPDWVDPHGIEPDGLITRIADTSTPMPGGEGDPFDDDDDDIYFSSFGPARPHVVGENLLFYGTSGIVGGYQDGIYQWNPVTGFTNLVDTNFEVPGKGVKFYNFRDAPFGSGEELVFSTWTTPYNHNTSVYRMTLGGAISIVADDATLIPGSQVSFNQFPESVMMENGEAAFIGQSLGNFGIWNYGIYLSNPNGDIEMLFDVTTRVPGGYGTFRSVSGLGTSGSRIVFQSSYKIGESILRSIFALSDGVIRPVVRPGDLIEGREVADVFIESDSLEGDSLAFMVRFTDAPNDIAIYLANIGEIENSPPLPIYVGGPGANTLAPVDAFSSDAAIPSFRAAEIELEDAATIHSVTFEGTYAMAQTIGIDAFTLQILNDDNGVNGDLPGSVASPPVALEVVSRTDTGVDEFGLDVYRYEANLASPIAIAAGSYWLSIANDTSDDADDTWRWTVATRGFFDPLTAQSTASQSGPYTSSLKGVPVFTLLATAFESLVAPGSGLSPARTVVQRPRRFRATSVGKRSRAQTLRISNHGGSTLGGLRVSAGGRAKREFLVVQPAIKSIAPGASTSFKASFRPRTKGVRRATLTVRSNAPAARVPISGRGNARP